MAAVAALFALFHGAAHGVELAGPAGAGRHGAGHRAAACHRAAGRAALRRRSLWWPRAAGIAVSLFGAALLFGGGMIMVPGELLTDAR